MEGQEDRQRLTYNSSVLSADFVLPVWCKVKQCSFGLSIGSKKGTKWRNHLQKMEIEQSDIWCSRSLS